MWTRMAGKDISVPNNSSQLGASKNIVIMFVISFEFHDPRYITYRYFIAPPKVWDWD